MSVRILTGDCRELLRTLPDASIDSVVTDPPYELGFMGKAWDASGIAYDVGMWREVLRVLKPGGHLLAFGGSRTYHRIACAIEDAGFEIRDKIDYYRSGQPERDAFLSSLTDEQQAAFLEAFGRPSMLAWTFGSGFPKSANVSAAIDRAAGAEREVTRPGRTKAAEYAGRFDQADSSTRERRDLPASEAAKQWDGWGTALKPAHEPIVCARKPFRGTVAANVLAHGTGALNIDACRIPGAKPDTTRGAGGQQRGRYGATGAQGRIVDDGMGRWPANVTTDGSDEVVAAFPDAPGQQADISTTAPSAKTSRVYGAMRREGEASADRVYSDAGATNFALKPGARRLDEGSAARFFYCAKPSADERNIGGVVNGHPTVKPLALMQYLVRLVTPPGGTVLDPFAGSGTTGIAADREGFDAVLIEQDPEYAKLARRRISGDAPLFAEVA